MTERTRPCFTSLPPELRSKIFWHTARSDLPAVRLTSRDCDRYAKELLFSGLITRTDKTKEQIRRCPTNFLSGFAKELRVSVVEWLDGQNGPACYYNERNDSDSNFFHDQTHRQQARIRYENVEAEHYAVPSGRYPGYLNLIFFLGKLQRVLFANGRFNPHVTPQSQCGLINCTYQLPVRRPFATHQHTNLHFRLLINSLAQSEIKIRELIVKDDHDSRFVLNYESFTLPPSPQAQIVFSNLTKMHLDLDTAIVHLSSPWDLHEPLNTSINQTLKYARDLENLSIRIVVRNREWGDQQNFIRVLHGCVFPKLKTCILSGFKCDIAALQQFFTNCSKLERLCLDWCWLFEPDTWEEVANRLTALPALKDVQLRQLFGILGTDDSDDALDDVYDDSGYDNRYGHVQDFFFRGGVNPFGAAGRVLERRKHEEYAEKVVTPGWFERMQKLHGYEEDLE
ncbi:MAG: hypothetical protein Q9199_005359 [Rusavskia elegans]